MVTSIIKISAGFLLPLLLSFTSHDVAAYRIKGSINETQHFVPYEKGSVGNAQQFTTAQTWSNQGYAESIVLGDDDVGKNRLTSCPKMVGPIDNEYFCRGKDYGYCDRRSGTCFCTEGYMGDACGECAPTHFEVGGICYPKTLCPNDCSGFGQCNYQTGKCKCNEYREGEDCSRPICSKYHEFCTTCDEDGCIECEDGFSSHKTAEWGEQCQACWRFDPRCRTCSEDACTSCIDLLLLSIHRSGRRPHDPPLPMDELTRELSITVPFGSNQVDAFYDAEHYFLVDPSIAPLNESAVECHQGLDNDDSISCMPYNLTSHRICGNHGTITFDSPEYAVREDNKHVRLTLRRSGGGVGEVAVSYSLYPITAGFEDVASNAYYTTNRTIVFRQGQITASFLVTINDDRILEPNETFSVHLSNPTGGASLGTQQRTIVTIIDDDSDMTCSDNVGANLHESSVGVAGALFQFDLSANTCSNDASAEGNDIFKVVARKLAWEESPLEIEYVDAVGNCGHSLENVYTCQVNATTSGNYELDVYHLIPGGLKGFYYTDNVLDDSRLDMIRTDALVNFTWGTGPVTTFGRDFVSVRWEGYVRPTHSETYTFWIDVDDHARMWIDGQLLIDWWTFPHASSMLHAEHDLSAFETHEIILEYRDILGNATARLLWSSESTPITAIPSSSLFYKEPIRGSPFEYVVLPATTHASQSQAIGEGVHTAIAGKQESFFIVPKDAHGNFRGWPHHALVNDERHFDVFHATAELLDNAQGDVTFAVDVTYDAASRYFVGMYTPRTSGHYRLTIYHEVNGNAMHIRGSPFALGVVPGDTFARESIAFGPVAFGPGLHNAVAGDVGTATIQAFDANRNMRNIGGDDWEVTIKSVSTNDYQYGTTQDHGNGTYSLQVVPFVAGPNDVSIMLDGSHARGSPFRINVVHGTVDGPSSFVVDEAEVSPMKAMMLHSFVIQAVDKWGNKAIYSDEHPHNTSISVHSESIDSSATNIKHVGGGKYEISVIPVLSGEIQLGIMLNGVDILGSPMSVSVHPGDFFAETSIATGVGLKKSQAGKRASFNIVPKDAGGNKKGQEDALFNVTLILTERAHVPVGMEIYDANMTDEVAVTGTQSFTDEGQYLIQYTCFEAGQYDLHINDYQGNSIAGSPFSVNVVPGQISGELSIMTGDGTLKGFAGQISPVRVFPRDAYQNFILDSQEIMEIDMTLLSRHESEWGEDDNNLVGEHTIKQRVEANSDGSFHLDYLTAYAGVYSLDVTTFLPGGLAVSLFSSTDFAPEHLVFSSIEANIDKDFGALPYTCQNNEDITCDSLSDMAGPYHIGAKWSGKLKAYTNERYEISAECNDEGHVSIAIDGVHMPWQPCWPSATTSAVLPSKQVDFELRYKNYEGNNPFVKLKWSSPSTGSSVAIPSSNLLYEEVIGNTLYPEIYPDSASAPLSNAIGDSLRHAVSGVEQEFLVESRDIHGNLLLSGNARVVSYAHNDYAAIETLVVDNRNGTFTVSYIAGVSGEFFLSIEIGELDTSHQLSHVKGSPFLLTVQPGRSDPDTSILSMDNDGLGVAGVPLLSRLQTRDFHHNVRYQGGDEIIAHLSAVETPSEKYRCQVDDDDSGTYLIECPSQWKEGSYHLDVSIESSAGNAEPLKSGPFNVTVFPGHAVASTTSVVSGGTSITADSGIPSVHFIGDAGVWGSFVVSTKDIFGNFLTTGGNNFVTRVVDNDEAEVHVIDQENGDYIVAYKVNEPSSYKIDVGMVTGSGLVGNYYLNETLLVPTITMIDERIDFNAWHLGKSFSHVTWTGYMSFPHNGKFELELTGIEGNCTVFVGSKIVVDSSLGSSIGSFNAVENVLYQLKIEYSIAIDINRLLLKMYWASAKMPKQIVPGSHYFNATEPIHGSPFHLTIL